MAQFFGPITEQRKAEAMQCNPAIHLTLKRTLLFELEPCKHMHICTFQFFFLKQQYDEQNHALSLPFK